MSWLHVWHAVPVNKSSRPVLTDSERNLFVKDGVGVYQGKLKILRCQDGRVYLTNKRVIYVDSASPQTAVAVYLADVASADFVDRFLRSSPKVKVYLKTGGGDQPAETAPSQPAPTTLVDWTCGICSFNNHMPVSASLDQAAPRCVSCGIPPSRQQLQAALAASAPSTASSDANSDQCPKCTFINHPSMRYCELCGSPLRQISASLSNRLVSVEEPAVDANPARLVLEDKETYTNDSPYIKLSFRKGGERLFFDALVAEIENLKWRALESKGGVNDDARKLPSDLSREPTPRIQSRGIQGLEKLGELQRKQNEIILSSSLDDLEQLMYKAQDILDVTSSFQYLIKKLPVSALKATPMPPLAINNTLTLFHQELARHICEFLLNFVLTKSTSMITSQDLFASYNRYFVMSQGFGTDLVTAQDFQKCFAFFDKLQLPVKLRSFSSGLCVVTQRLQDLQDIHQIIMEHLADAENAFMYQKFSSELLADTDGYMKDTYRVFHGKTVAEIAEHFGWSAAICMEELDKCVGEGKVVLDKHVLGTFYFANKFDEAILARLTPEDELREKAVADVQAQQASISSELKFQHDIKQNLLAFNEYGFGSGTQNEPAVREPEPTAASETLSLLSGLKF